jgi:hypothetical protein
MLAQAQECAWQWAVMGAITSWFGPYQTFPTSEPRSQLKRDYSKVSCSGRLLCLFVLFCLAFLSIF